MKRVEMAKKGLYAGAGSGLVLFALIGLLPGSFIGGVIGINVAGKLFGLPLETTVVPRIIVGAAMLLGVMVASMVFVVGCALVGWIIGHAVDVIRDSRATSVEHTIKS